MLVISVFNLYPDKPGSLLKGREEFVPEPLKVAGTSGRLRQK
ncbi:hypothetical protein [Sphingobacterium spiritivorum]